MEQENFAQQEGNIHKTMTHPAIHNHLMISTKLKNCYKKLKTSQGSYL